MIDYMLKFADKAEAEAILVQAGIMQMLEDRVAPVQNHAVDIIGTIYKFDGTFTEGEGGFQIPNQTELEGYHVNVRTNSEFEILAPFIVNPTTPHRVWA